MNTEDKQATNHHHHVHNQAHDHAHAEHANEDDHDHGNPFFIPFILILVFAVLELAGGLWTQSLALLSDAWHMFSDVFALGLAMFAAHSAKQAVTQQRTSRAELFASMINAVMMLVVIVWIVMEAIERLQAPKAVAGGYVMLIAFIGLIVNLIVAYRLHHLAEHHDGKQNLNQRAALVHVLGDLLGSVAALLAGAIIYFSGWLAIDPILSILISILLLVVTINLIKEIYLTARGKKQTTSHHHHHH